MLEFNIARRNINSNKYLYSLLITILSLIYALMAVFLNGIYSDGVLDYVNQSNITSIHMLFSIVVKFVVVFIFALTIMIFRHISKFIIDSRLKEFGLFRLSGISNKSLSRILAFENCLIFISVILIGFILSVAISKLINYLLDTLIIYDIALRITLNLSSYLVTTTIFIVMFIIVIKSLNYQLLKRPLAELFNANQTLQVKKRPSKVETVITFICSLILIVSLELVIQTKSLNGIEDISIIFVLAVVAIFTFTDSTLNGFSLLLPSRVYNKTFNSITYSRISANLANSKRLITMSAIFFALAVGLITCGDMMFKSYTTYISTDDFSWTSRKWVVDGIPFNELVNNDIDLADYDFYPSMVVENESLGADKLDLTDDQIAIVGTKSIDTNINLDGNEFHLFNTTKLIDDDKFKDVLADSDTIVVNHDVNQKLKLSWDVAFADLANKFTDYGKIDVATTHMFMNLNSDGGGSGLGNIVTEDDANKYLEAHHQKPVDVRPGEAIFFSPYDSGTPRTETVGDYSINVTEERYLRGASATVIDQQTLDKYDQIVASSKGTYSDELQSYGYANVNDESKLPEINKYMTEHYTISNYSFKYDEFTKFYNKYSIVLFISFVIAFITIIFILVYNATHLLVDSLNFKEEYKKLEQLGITNRETKIMIGKYTNITLGFGYLLGFIVWLLGYQFIIMLFTYNADKTVLFYDNVVVIGFVTFWYILVSIIIKRTYYMIIKEK